MISRSAARVSRSFPVDFEMMHDMDDGALLELWSRGDLDAGNQLFERHLGSLHRFFSNKLGGSSEVEDLVQQTLAACVAASGRYRREASFRTFIFAIARNTLLKHLRDRRAEDTLDAEAVSVADCGLGPSSVLRAKREQRLLLRALRHIPIDSQVVLEMYYWEPMPAREIARVLGETEPVVRGRLRKAKAQLVERIEQLARERETSRSTVDGLETWIRSLRGYWGGS